MTLNNIPQDSDAEICEISENVISSRLLEMGFYPHQKLQVIGRAPFGDPIAVRIGNSTVMLRSAEAKCISVKLAS